MSMQDSLNAAGCETTESFSSKNNNKRRKKNPTFPAIGRTGTRVRARYKRQWATTVCPNYDKNVVYPI